MFDMSDLSHWLSVLGELWIGAQETFFSWKKEIPQE